MHLKFHEFMLRKPDATDISALRESMASRLDYRGSDQSPSRDHANSWRFYGINEKRRHYARLCTPFLVIICHRNISAPTDTP